MKKPPPKADPLPEVPPPAAPAFVPAALPACVLACPGSLALLYRVQVLGDLPAESFDDSWDSLPDPDAYAPAPEVEDWLRQHWEELFPDGQSSRKFPPCAPAREDAGDAFSRLWMKGFLASFRLTGIVTAATEGLHVTPRAVYKARARDPEFARAWQEAERAAADRLEAEAFRRAHDGCTRAVYGAGPRGAGTVEVGKLTEYSDTLLVTLLKARSPEKFREKPVTIHNSANANATAATGLEITPEVLARLQARRKKQLCPDEDAH